MSTRVTARLPKEAADKILADPSAFAKYLIENGCIELVRIEPSEVFRWEHSDGTIAMWDISKAKSLVDGKRPVAEITPTDCLRALQANVMVCGMDAAYALTKDIEIPIIATVPPLLSKEEEAAIFSGTIPYIVIDGWHRILKAALTFHQHPLKMHILTTEEDKLCRIVQEQIIEE